MFLCSHCYFQWCLLYYCTKFYPQTNEYKTKTLVFSSERHHAKPPQVKFSACAANFPAAATNATKSINFCFTKNQIYKNLMRPRSHDACTNWNGNDSGYCPSVPPTIVLPNATNKNSQIYWEFFHKSICQIFYISYNSNFKE